MSLQRVRRALLGLVCLSGVLLAGCGGGEVVSQLTPKRLLVFGDAFSDIGQAGPRYTINGDPAISNWTEQVALRYGLTVRAQSAGGTSFAVGNARIGDKPDAAGVAATPTVTEQIDAFVAGGGRFAADDMVIVSAGISDLVVQLRRGGQSTDQGLANAAQVGRALGAQVRRLVNAGAEHVVVVGPYNLGRTPWARSTGQTTIAEQFTTRFNESLLISIVDLGANVLYVDVALYYNLVTGNPGSYGLSNVTEAACSTRDPGAGIGIGNGQVSSALCTTGNLPGGVDRNTFLFADPLYPTPVAHRLFGDYAWDRIHRRW